MELVMRAGRVAWRGVRFAVRASPVPPEHHDKVALYLLNTGCNLPGATAADIYGCSKQYVSKAMRAVEDLRDDAGFNAALEALERELGVGEP